MIGIYLSGTGNTKHCVEKLVNLLDDTVRCIPLETPYIINMLENENTIVLGYPTQFSNAPFMVRDFIRKNRCLWKDKKVFCVNTMGLFSGDGTGCTARLLKKYGAEILGGLQIKMPDSVCDSKLQIVKNADKRIEQTAEQIKKGIYPKEGLSFIAHIKGLFGQRLWFYRKTIYYTEKLKISDFCIGCGLCTVQCKFDAIHLHRELPDASNMVPSEDKLKYILPNGLKQAIKIKFGGPKGDPRLDA